MRINIGQRDGSEVGIKLTGDILMRTEHPYFGSDICKRHDWRGSRKCTEQQWTRRCRKVAQQCLLPHKQYIMRGLEMSLFIFSRLAIKFENDDTAFRIGDERLR